MKISYKILHYLKAVKEQMTTLKQEYKDGMQDFKKKKHKATERDENWASLALKRMEMKDKTITEMKLH